MPRFVVLFHECPSDSPRSSHFDVMLESDGALRTWAIAALPGAWSVAPGSPGSSDAPATESVAATQLPNHRLAYLDYEGPISDDRGTVSRIEAGTFVSIEESTDEWVVELTGERIRGRVTLQCAQETSSQWQLTFLPAAAETP
jgi:hypothetical protein